MIVEVTGRIFHIHVPVELEDGSTEEFTADVAMEESMGLLMISSGGVSTYGSWPNRDQWGTKTFKEFLCSRTPSWIVSKMLGQDALIFDEGRTRKALQDTIGLLSPDSFERIEELIQNIDSYGEILAAGESASQELDALLEEPCDGFIFMETTGFAQFLIEGVLPQLLDRLAPPPVVKNQTNLKLC